MLWQKRNADGSHVGWSHFFLFWLGFIPTSSFMEHVQQKQHEPPHPSPFPRVPLPDSCRCTCHVISSGRGL